MLRLAACLEEHYPHSIANAVVAEARDRGLNARGVSLSGPVRRGARHFEHGGRENRSLIGSAHFVFEDEGCRVPEGEEDKFESLPPEYSHLYLCIAGELAAVICIHDPLRKEAQAAVRALHELGIDKARDDDRRQPQDCPRPSPPRSASTTYYAEVLPEDKADVRPPRARGQGPHGHHDRRRRERFACPLRSRRGHRHLRRRGHRARDRRHHRSASEDLVRPAHAQAHLSDALMEPHPPQLPLHRGLQPARSIVSRRRGHPAARRHLPCCTICPRSASASRA